jgi:cytochrome c biogenesis protein CcmG, thiol:disulfide interchange protein DsbE
MAADVQDRRVFKPGYILPLVILAGMSALFVVALRSGDPSRLPSALIGKPVPQFTLPPVEGIAQSGKDTPGFSSADLASGQVTIVNVWASWCGPCIQEHPNLSKLKGMPGVRLVSINYKDAPDAALRFLTRLGNPYDAIGADRSGRVAIDWGVYGVPETYIVDGKGMITHKVVGPISDDTIRSEIMPAIAAAKASAQHPSGQS